MLRRILKQKRYFKNIYKEQKGITGLETAIILIAFVVVAAVFAYTVLSAGLFSTQKSQEAVYNGLQETQNTLEVKGAVLSQANPKDFDNADDASTWAAGGAAGTIALDNTNIHESTGSILVTGVGTPVVDALLARTTAASITASQNDTITFWAKLGSGTDGGKLGFAAAAATGGLVTASVTKATISATDTAWHLYTMTVGTVGASQSLYVGVFALTTGFATDTVNIDDVEVNNVSLWQSTYLWTPYASNIILVLSLATGGQSIDFSPGTTITNGLFTGTKTNKVVVNYNDAYQHFSDVAWTGSFIGNNNSDYMLDPGEKIQITISLAALATGSHQMGVNHQFTLELKTPKGAILSLQRTMPARLYGIDNLN